MPNESTSDEDSGTQTVGRSTLGPVTIPIRPVRYTGPDYFAYVKDREVVRGRVRNCQSCPLFDLHSGPVPYAYPVGPEHPKLCVVGEAPGNMEDRRGEPFVGKSGTLLRTKLRKAGFTSTDVAYANTISCRPTSGDYRTAKDRTPTHDECVACRGNLFDQLGALRAGYVLLAGQTATQAFRPDLKIGRNHGRVYVWEQEWVVVITYHPSAALRNRDMERIFHDDIGLMRLLCKGEIDPADLVSEWCTYCGEMAEFYDPNLAGFCEAHWKAKPRKPHMPSTQQMWHQSTREGQWKGKGRKRGSAIPLGLFGDDVGRVE